VAPKSRSAAPNQGAAAPPAHQVWREALAHQPARLYAEHLVDAAPVLIVGLDGDGIVRLVNPAVERFTGYRHDALIGRDWFELVVPRDRYPEAWARFAHAMRRQHLLSAVVEHPIVTRSGEERYISWQNCPVYHEGWLVGALAIGIDTSERKRAEAATRFLAEASALLAVSLDYETTLGQVARLALPLLGDACVIDLIEDGQPPRQIVAAPDDPGLAERILAVRRRYPLDGTGAHPVAQVLRTGRPVLLPRITRAYSIAVGRDATHQELIRGLALRSLLCVPLLARGRTLGTLSFIMSATSRRHDQADLALAEQLAHRAALAIDNARLYQAMQAAVHLREEFISIASHELRTPLTTVKGYVQLLARQTRQPRGELPSAAWLLDQLQAQIDRFEALVNDLLDAAQVRQGQLALRRERVDLAALARQVVARFEHAAERTPAHRLLLDAAAPVVGHWDAARLDQVLTNLLSNALKYSPAGGDVCVTVERHDGAAVLRVSDQGVGIAAADQADIFQPFVRAAATRQLVKGVGLGLYVVAQIVARHGGTITVESEPGHGTTFTVCLPWAAAPGGSPRPARHGQTASRAGGRS
jgi:PAS domain S-box-containing protein